jgi:aminopeptidase
MGFLRFLRPYSVVSAAVCALAACNAEKPNVPAATATPAAANPVAPAAPKPDLKKLAASMVKAGLVKPGDKVMITGSPRDGELLDELAIETMKAGGQPLISIWSEKLTHRSYDEVQETYDAQVPSLVVALNDMIDVTLSVDVGESDNPLQGVPASRINTRAKANQAVVTSFSRRNIRQVNLGNGLYPTATLAKRLGKSEAELAQIFWKASAVPAETIRAKGESVRSNLASAKEITIAGANGTNIKLSLVPKLSTLSDGALTPEKAKQTGFNAATWLPAGELLFAVANGSAEGKIVIDKIVLPGGLVEGLTLNFEQGKATTITATSGLDAFKSIYDPATGTKDQLAYIDIGLNPEVELPVNTGRIVYMVPGAITIGMGENVSLGGPNLSSFAFQATLTGPTLTADGKKIIANGVLN